ncbi:MAG: SgcJ/EcaC family oxidoreductase [Pirellulales bacterium]|nr:SgcJ/EcaC family oxidoreductase [Pirellulales bacterium]
MKTIIYLLAIAVGGLASLSAAEKKEPATPADQIRENARAFVAAFNRGDAQAVAAFWTEDGDYVDEQGRRIQGPAAIEKEYAAFFAAHPGVKLNLEIDAIRPVTESTAIEDGRSSLEPPPPKSPKDGRYTVVHVKRNGRWRMAGVRDVPHAPPANENELQDLDFLVGTWKAENHDVKVELTGRWIVEKNFIELSYTVVKEGHSIASAKQIIGWDPRTENVTSWTFSSEGGHAVGTWTPCKAGWIIEASGVTSDRTPTHAVNVLTTGSKDTLTWKSQGRSKGGLLLPDLEEVVFHRK